MPSFPRLYKLNSSQKMLVWDLGIEYNENGSGTIITQHGQEAGKQQYNEDTITEGKNQGKANETSPQQQAHAEATSKWDKQRETKGYVEDRERAAKGETDRGCIQPMLAKDFAKYHHKITYPAFVQPKLDGMRCIAVIQAGEVNLFSREGKPIVAVPHINAALAETFQGIELTLDGELYNHELKDDFENLISLVRRKNSIDETQLMQYHIYDLVLDEGYTNRYADLGVLLPPEHLHLKLVDTLEAPSEEAVHEITQIYQDLGYEGGIVREKGVPYENKRSFALQKVKTFLEEEFPILGIKEGRGKLAGKVKTFVCKTGDGKEFDAKPEGSMERLTEFFTDHSTWEGKVLTVKFQNWTKKGIPRGPAIGKEIRDYE